MDTQRRHPLAQPRRGFTLVELGIAVAVMAVVVGVVAGVSRGFLRAARTQRTADEMARLLAAARNAAVREIGTDLCVGLPPSAPCESPDTITGFAGATFPPAGFRCFDLSNGGWGGAENRRPAMDQTLWGPATLTADRGKNAYGKAIAVCVFPRSIQVATCVPEDDVPRTIAGAAPYPCPDPPGTFTCQAIDGLVARCIAVTAVLVPPNLSRLGMSYRYLYWGRQTTAP